MPDDPPRLLVVTYHFPPDGSVGGLRWAGITKYLTRLGWQVAVVTAAAPIASDPAVRAHVEWCPRRRTLIDYYRDRKSTRLNSSHGYISYAVFCLKKKKKHSRIKVVRAHDSSYLHRQRTSASIAYSS